MRIILTNEGKTEFSKIKPLENKEKPIKNSILPKIKQNKNLEANNQYTISKIKIKNKLIQLNLTDLNEYLFDKKKEFSKIELKKLVSLNSKRLKNWNRLCLKENPFFSKDCLQKAVENRRMIEKKGIDYEIKENLLGLKGSLRKAEEYLKFGNVKVFEKNYMKLNENHDYYKRLWIKYNVQSSGC